MRRGGLSLLAVALAAAGGVALVGDGDGEPAGERPSAGGAPAERPRGAARAGRAERPASGDLSRPATVVGLPSIGRLTWRCDRDGRVATRLRLAGASVHVSVRSDGRRVFHRRSVSPGRDGGGGIETPLARVRVQEWSILFHHPVPHPMRASVRIRFAVDREAGDCFVERSSTEVRRASGGPPRWLVERYR